MGQFAPLIEKLSEETLDGLAADDMGVLNLGEVVALLRLIREELQAGEALSPDEITDSLRNDVLNGSFEQQLQSLLAAMHQYGVATANPSDERNQFLNQARTLRNIVLDRVRPLLKVDEARLQHMLAEAEQAINSLSKVNAELSKQQTALAATSAGAAASDLSKHYKEQAESHFGSARTFLYATTAAGAVLVVLTGWLLFKSPPDYTDTGSTEQWIEVIRGTVARLVVLSIAAFALAFCARNYRVNMHLEVLNKRRENALNTFGLMQASVTSDDARNILVGELVRAVFTSEETGYLSAETERTVIESPGGAGILSALSAVRSQAQ